MDSWWTPPLSQNTSRTLHVSCADIGTAFFVDHNKKQYLVTAAHVAGESCGQMRVQSRGQWVPFPCEVLTRCTTIDVSILRMETKFNFSSNIRLSKGHLVWGQPVWFLGFPYGDTMELPMHFDGKLPHPFVKWGSLSAFGSGPDSHQLVVDAVNNPGFSGGPIGFTTNDGVQSVCGMVTGFKEEIQFVDSQTENISPMELAYKTNAGLLFATDANSILALIEDNPTGHDLD